MPLESSYFKVENRFFDKNLLILKPRISSLPTEMWLSSMQTVGLLLILFLFSFASLMHTWAISRKLKHIPGSTGWPVIGETLSFISEFSGPRGICNFMIQRQKRYGGVFKTNVLGRFTVFMTGREASKILLSGKDGLVSLNLFYTGKQVLGPNSLLQATGELHKRLRRLIGDPLSVDGVKRYFKFINDLAIEMLDTWPGRTVNVLDEASMFTLKIIGNMMMGIEPWGEEQEKFRANFKIISSAFASLPINLPGFAFYNGIKARNEMYSMIDSAILQRRRHVDYKSDFLGLLVRKHSDDSRRESDADDNDDKLSDSQVKDNILTLLIAGHDTTTAALTWLIKFVEENPFVLQKLREEHLGIQESRNGDPNLTWSDVNNMTYTNKVINETLREATILPWFSRKAAQDFEINGCQIKKGWSVNLNVVSIHHDPELFVKPNLFDPSRFNMPVKPFSFLGFGSGPRMCPGVHLARLELSVFIHHLVTRYKWKPLSRDDSVHPTLVRMPRNKYPIVVETL